jgi:uncharacterized protein YraI
MEKVISKKTLIIWVGILTSILLGSCNYPDSLFPEPAPIGEGVAVAIAEPVDGENLRVGDWVDIKTLVMHPSGARTVKLIVNGVVHRQDYLNISLQQGNMYQPWQPLEPGVYTLQVVAEGSYGSIETNIITVTVGEGVAEAIEIPPIDDPTVTNTVLELGTQTSTPSLTPSQTATIASEESIEDPTATANQDANCRYGPGPVYGVESAMLTGQSALILGRNDDSSWWLVERSNAAGGSCWVWGDLVSVSGDADQVPLVAAPPTPTHTSTATPPPTYTPTSTPTITQTPTTDPCVVSPSSCITASP